jgi:hypothetical protein
MLGLVCAHQLIAAEPIDSKVIHHDTFVSLAYDYGHDLGNSGVDTHGVLAGGSFERQNLLLSVSGGYAWTDEGNVDLWKAGGAVGYVFRMMENHINIIPRVGIFYNEILFADDTAEDVTTLEPSITVSYAINNQVSVNGGYLYRRDIDFDNDEGDTHNFIFGSRVAVAENMGVDLSILFTEDFGFSGATVGLQFHF